MGWLNVLIRIGMAAAAICCAATLAACSPGVPPKLMSACLAEEAAGEVPVDGYPLSTIVNYWQKSGASVGLQRDGQLQVLNIRGKVPRTGEKIAISLRMLPGKRPFKSDQCGPDVLAIQAMVVDGQPITGFSMQDVIFPFVHEAANELGLPEPKFADTKPKVSAVAPPIPRGPPTNYGAMPDTLPSGLAPIAGSSAGTALTGRVTGNCRVNFKGHDVMNGGCAGMADARTVVATADKGGCTVELTRAGSQATAKLYGYRDTCWIDEAAGISLDEDANLGTFVLSDGCWTGPAGRVCLAAK